MPIDEDENVVPNNEKIKVETTSTTKAEVMNNKKWFVRGNEARSKELKNKFIELTKPNVVLPEGFDMSKKQWVYFVDSKGDLCSTTNCMVIDLLENSSDWEEYKLPDPIRFTKEQIAKMIGMDINEFTIEGK